jgi:hypothetical protein
MASISNKNKAQSSPADARETKVAKREDVVPVAATPVPAAAAEEDNVPPSTIKLNPGLVPPPLIAQLGKCGTTILIAIIAVIQEFLDQYSDLLSFKVGLCNGVHIGTTPFSGHYMDGNPDGFGYERVTTLVLSGFDFHRIYKDCEDLVAGILETASGGVLLRTNSNKGGALNYFLDGAIYVYLKFSRKTVAAVQAIPSYYMQLKGRVDKDDQRTWSLKTVAALEDEVAALDPDTDDYSKDGAEAMLEKLAKMKKNVSVKVDNGK